MDIITWAEESLVNARRAAAAAVDRAEALVELRSLAFELAQRIGATHLSLEAAEGALEDEHERARYQALCRRAIADTDTERTSHAA